MSSLTDRLELPDAVLSRADLRSLGWPRRAIDALVRNVGVVVIDDYSRPLIRVCDYRRYVADHLYDGRTRVR